MGTESSQENPAAWQITRVMLAAKNGSDQAALELLPSVYDELRELAAHRMLGERKDHTLQATALVHEAYARPMTPMWQAFNSTLRGCFGNVMSSKMQRQRAVSRWPSESNCSRLDTWRSARVRMRWLSFWSPKGGLPQAWKPEEAGTGIAGRHWTRSAGARKTGRC